jgi:hypothetical protein
MGAVTSIRVPASLQTLAETGMLLERLERLPRSASAVQYREVVLAVQRLLGEAEPSDALDALLRALPATAELYENLRFAHAGLCRSPLDAAAMAEVAARDALTRIASSGPGR